MGQNSGAGPGKVPLERIRELRLKFTGSCEVK
jgi:hypothetical protein